MASRRFNNYEMNSRSLYTLGMCRGEFRDVLDVLRILESCRRSIGDYNILGQRIRIRNKIK